MNGNKKEGIVNMSREILFRGQTRRKGEKVRMGDGKPLDSNWVYGGILPQNNGGDFAIIYTYEPIEKRVVYSDTVCQFTGMYDCTKWEELTEEDRQRFLSEYKYGENCKNTKEDWKGRKIFENDICEMVYDGNSYTYVIVWDDEEQDFKGTNGKENYGRNFEYMGCCEELVVIGNKFDNPELLKDLTAK